MALELLKQQLGASAPSDVVAIKVGAYAVQNVTAGDLAKALGVTQANYGSLWAARDGIRIRDKEGTGNILGAVNTCDEVIIVDEESRTSGDYLWRKVRAVKAGITGWTAVYDNRNAVAWYLTKNPCAQPSSATKIGFHMMGGISEAEQLRAFNEHAAIYKSVDTPDFLIRAHAANPNAYCIYRQYIDDGLTPEAYIAAHGGDVTIAVNAWMAGMEGYFKAMPWAYFESFNEKGASPLYCAFEALRTRVMKARGLKSCILNIGAGQTDEKVWRTATDAVRATIEAGSLVGVHGYATGVIGACYGGTHWEGGEYVGEMYPPLNPYPATVEPPACYAFRVEQDIYYLRKLGLGGVKIAITELGWDDMSNDNLALCPREGKVNGIKTVIPVWINHHFTTEPMSFAREQMRYAGRVLARLDEVVGGCWYNYGQSQKWDAFDVRMVYL